jgi:hypothetical protein
VTAAVRRLLADRGADLGPERDTDTDSDSVQSVTQTRTRTRRLPKPVGAVRRLLAGRGADLGPERTQTRTRTRRLPKPVGAVRRLLAGRGADLGPERNTDSDSDSVQSVTQTRIRTRISQPALASRAGSPAPLAGPAHCLGLRAAITVTGPGLVLIF